MGAFSLNSELSQAVALPDEAFEIESVEEFAVGVDGVVVGALVERMLHAYQPKVRFSGQLSG